MSRIGQIVILDSDSVSNGEIAISVSHHISYHIISYHIISNWLAYLFAAEDVTDIHFATTISDSMQIV